MNYRAELPDAIDLSHHLSKVARARAISPLKELQKYLERDDITYLAGGLPHPSLFPFDEVSASVYFQNAFPTVDSSSTKSPLVSWITRLFSGKSQGRLDKLKIKKYAKHPGDLNLAKLLQYGLSSGLPDLQRVIENFVGRVYKPAYANWAALIHTGNTDGWLRAVMTFCDPGDIILTCEWTYPSAIAASRPLGIEAVPVAMDGEGMRSDVLLGILSGWDENKRGAPRPRVMYTVPVGQNPTGATMGIQRKRQIYEICVKFDVIIVEDDPYFFLQVGPYTSRQERIVSTKEVSNEAFIASLVPSYLSLDYQGRVVRLDSFSKTVAPGCRLGWFTCNPLFRERFERQGECGNQAACGFSQGFVTALLTNWGFDGYVRWLNGLRAQYRERRDFCVDCFADFFDLKARLDGGTYTVYDGYIKRKPATSFNHWSEKFIGADRPFPVFSLVPPTSGMFLWIQLNFRDHPSSSRLGHKDLEVQLCKDIADAGVIVGPGFIFSPKLAEHPNDEGPGHIRLSFSSADLLVLRKAIGTMATVLERFFYERDQL